MEDTFTTAGREWKVDERVIIVSTNSPAPRVFKIHSVAPKSFVVNGERFSREKLRDGVPSKSVGDVWPIHSLTVIPLDSPDAPYRLAERALYKQWRQVYSAQTEWDRVRTVDSADGLRTELAAWIEARKVLDAEKAKRDGR